MLHRFKLCSLLTLANKCYKGNSKRMRILSMTNREYFHRHLAICEVRHKISEKHIYLTYAHGGVDSPCLFSVRKLDKFMSCANDSKFSWIINCFHVLRVQSTDWIRVCLRRCFQVWIQLHEKLCFVYSLPNIIGTNYK
jgi:hypothetical protein